MPSPVDEPELAGDTDDGGGGICQHTYTERQRERQCSCASLSPSLPLSLCVEAVLTLLSSPRLCVCLALLLPLMVVSCLAVLLRPPPAPAPPSGMMSGFGDSLAPGMAGGGYGGVTSTPTYATHTHTYGQHGADVSSVIDG